MVQGEGQAAEITSLVRATEILEYVIESDGARLTEISTALDIPKSSASRHVHTLESQGLLTKKGKCYQGSLKILKLGKKLQKNYDPDGLVHDHIMALCDLTEERAQFMVMEDNKMVYAYREVGRRGVTTDTMAGNQMPLHATSGGKVFLASLPEGEREAILDEIEFEQYTENTITRRAELEEELDRIQEDGYSINEEEYMDGLRAISVPMELFNGNVFGSIGVSGPTHRIKSKISNQNLVDKLLGTSNEIMLKYEYAEPISSGR